MLIDFQMFPITLNLAVFAVAAGAVWLLGTKVSLFADAISDRTGMGKAFMGLLFLALVTEMPEIGTTVSASIAGNADLAVNNIFGGVIFQTAVLAIVDLILIRGALTFFTPSPVLMLQGVLLIVLLAITLAAIAATELVTILGVGLWSILLLLTYIFVLYLSHQYEGQEEWEPTARPSEEEMENVVADNQKSQQKAYKNQSTRTLVVWFAAGAVAILAAGVILAQVGEAIAVQTGLGTSLIGATLLAASTSLPELSTTTAAIRIGNYEMAISNIFGSNSIMILLLFTSDIFYPGGPIINEVGGIGTFNAAMGILVTGVYLAGLIERRDSTVLRMGVDSALVLGAYFVSVPILYSLR